MCTLVASIFVKKEQWGNFGKVKRIDLPPSLPKIFFAESRYIGIANMKEFFNPKTQRIKHCQEYGKKYPHRNLISRRCIVTFIFTEASSTVIGIQ